jgi:hypothetical protein
MVQIAVSWCRKLESPEADIVEGLIVNAESLVGVLDELMNGECRIVGLSGGCDESDKSTKSG